MRLLLIRHGEINFNRESRYCGITDVPINRTGIAQARQLKLLIANEKIDRIYCSPLRRAKETARIIFGQRPAHRQTRRIRIEPALAEINFGKLECLTVAEVRKKFPYFYQQWLTNLEEAKPPGGESVAQCRKRIWQFICSLIKGRDNHHKTIALVMHGGPIKILISKILNLGPNGFWRFHPEPASVTTIEYDSGRFCLVGRNFYYGKDKPGFGWRP
jgi:broad specificity phosphatase PhoE